MENTLIQYLYRDADNYKVQNECVIKGVLSEEDIQTILDSLEDDEVFIPRLVGLPEKRFDTYDPQVDHPFFELGKTSFIITDQHPTVEITAAELVSAFRKAKGHWHMIMPERVLELLNTLIDNMINDEGGHSRRVLGRLLDLGFSKEELLALQFPEQDVEDLSNAEEEDEEDV